MTVALRAVRAAVAMVAGPALLALPAAAADFFVVPAKVSLPVYSIVVGSEVDQVVKTTLKEKDLVNLALGRPRGSKVDKKTELLALAVTPEAPSSSALSRLVVFDPQQGSVTTVVADAMALEYDAVGGTGQGTVTATIQQTTLGAPAQHALLPATVRATAVGASPPLVAPGLGLKVAIKGAAAGRFSFRSFGATVSGFIVNGKVKTAGKVIGHFSE